MAEMKTQSGHEATKSLRHTKKRILRVFLCEPLWLSVFVSILFFVNVGVAQESPHGKIRFECGTCHSTETWKMKKGGFNHEATGFALTGQHKTVQCATCHEGLKFAKKSSNCLSCHTDVHKSELGANMENCRYGAEAPVNSLPASRKTRNTELPNLSL
jgi:hypothetical protein